MYKNYGDRNFFEHGILADDEHSDSVISLIRCEPYPDEEDLYQFAKMDVDVDDPWIDRKAVMDYAGMKEFDPVEFAIAASDYYSWENFGASSYGVFYDWQHMTKAEIRQALKGELIAYDHLDPII